MATYYVSNAATQGYALGSDANDGLSKAAPFLTIDKGLNVAGTADTVTVNPSATPYSENGITAGGYAQLRNCGTLTGDPDLYTASGLRPIVRSTSGSAIRVFHIGTNITTRVIANLIVDQELVSGKAGFNGVTGSNLTFRNIEFRNGAQYCIANPGVACNIVLDNVTIASSYTTTSVFAWTASTTIASLVVKGGNYFAPSGASAVFFANVGAVWGPVTFQADDLGNATTFTGCLAGSCIRATGTMGAVTLTGVNMTGTPGGVYIATGGVMGALTITGCAIASTTTLTPVRVDGTAGAVTITNSTFTGCAGGAVFFSTSSTGLIRISGCTFTNLTTQPAIRCNDNSAAPGMTVTGNTFSGGAGFLGITSDSLNSPLVSDNTITMAGDSINQGIYMVAPGRPRASNNTISIAAPTAAVGAIQFGGDGISSITAGNAGAATGTQPLGSTANNVRVAQKFTTVAEASSADFSHVAAVEVFLSKTGSPTGNVTARLYSQSGSLPGTLLGTSETTITAASLTGTSTLYGFVFAPIEVVGGTVYWVEIGVAGGTTDGSNHVLLDYNATTTVGAIATGTSVPAWTADAAKSLRFDIMTGNYFMLPICDDNTITYAGGPLTTSMQAITLGGCLGGDVYGNRVTAVCYYPIVLKNLRGGVTRCYGNIVTLNSDSSSSGCVYPKASDNVRVYNNVLILTGATVGDVVTIGGGSMTWANNIQSSNIRVANNILYRAGSVSGPVYQIGAGSTGITVDRDLVYTDHPAALALVSAVSKTWAEFQGLGYAAAGQGPAVDPVFRNYTGGDFRLRSTSPAINAGTDLRSDAPADFAGTQFTATPTIGAYTWLTRGLTSAREIDGLRSLS